MPWEIIISLHVVAGATAFLYVRRVTALYHQQFLVGLIAYYVIAVAGWILTAATIGKPDLQAAGQALPFIILQGVLIPAAWFFDYRLISHVGASSAAIAVLLKPLMVALLGILIVKESVSAALVVGGAVMMLSVLVTFSIRKPSTDSKQLPVPVSKKLFLAVGGSVLYAIGILGEKLTIDTIGVWSYTSLGWSVQAVGATLILLVFARNEITKVSLVFMARSILVGLLTVTSGVLFVYALSVGSLSGSALVASGRTALVVAVAALLFKERNRPMRRIVAFTLMLAGLAIILS